MNWNEFKLKLFYGIDPVDSSKTYKTYEGNGRLKTYPKIDTTVPTYRPDNALTIAYGNYEGLTGDEAYRVQHGTPLSVIENDRAKKAEAAKIAANAELANKYKQAYNPKSEETWKTQEVLNGMFGENLLVDGIMGPKTREAIKRAQRLLGVKDDGIWGAKTQEAFLKSQYNRPIDNREMAAYNRALDNSELSYYDPRYQKDWKEIAMATPSQEKLKVATPTLPNITLAKLGGKINASKWYK